MNLSRAEGISLPFSWQFDSDDDPEVSEIPDCSLPLTSRSLFVFCGFGNGFRIALTMGKDEGLWNPNPSKGERERSPDVDRRSTRIGAGEGNLYVG